VVKSAKPYSVVDATDEMCLVGFEAARRFWPGKIPGAPADYADVFRLLVPCLDESSSFEGALMIRVMAEENLAERTRFRMELKRRKQERLRREARERAKLERAVTAKQRGKLEEAAEERAALLKEQRREYRKEQDRMTAGRTTRPLNLREVVAAWDEIKLHASMKFGCELETNVGWEGRTVQPAGLQAVVNEVREAFSAGDLVLSVDDTVDDTVEDGGEEEGEEGEGEEGEGGEKGEGGEGEASSSSSSSSLHEQWLSTHRLHHGVKEFFEVCRRDGHSVMVLGGPGRSGALCREVLAHMGVAVEAGEEEEDEEEGLEGEGEEGVAVRVVGAEYGSARGLAVAAMMGQHEMPWWGCTS
jgi:hypothetical protein